MLIGLLKSIYTILKLINFVPYPSFITHFSPVGTYQVFKSCYLVSIKNKFVLFKK